MSDEHRLVAELAKRVEAVFDAETVRERLLQTLDALLKGTQIEVGKVARESLLLYRGQISENRDREWARVMASIWVQDPEAQVPINPHDLQAFILAKQAVRERHIAKEKQQDGFDAGWRAAVKRCTELGWGAASAGKSLDEALSAAQRLVA